jgi:zinc transport system substrate-binding protein
MKKHFLLIAFTMLLVGLAACQQSDDLHRDIVTTMFPQYDFASQIVKDEMTVSLIIPPGAEVHGFEASSRDIEAITNAKLFIYTSDEIDAWIAGAPSIFEGETHVLNLSEHVEDLPHDHAHETSVITTLEEDDHDHDHADDIHFWTDPIQAIHLIETILEAIIAIDPDNALIYTENAQTTIDALEEVHHTFDLFMRSLTEDAHIYYAGHNAMGMFASRYHIEIISLFDDFKPDADLTSLELITFTDIVKTAGVHTLFIEELAVPKAALAIQRELSNQGFSLTLLELHGYHNVTKDDFDQGITYLDLFRQNTNHIMRVLEPS